MSYDQWKTASPYDDDPDLVEYTIGSIEALQERLKQISEELDAKLKDILSMLEEL